MNPVLLKIGNIKIYWYSITMFLGILIGGILVLKEAKKHRISENFIYNLFFYIIPIALIGARLYYVIFNWNYYSQNLTSIFKVWEGGLAIHGGIIAGLIFIIFYTKKHRINTIKLLDFIVVGLIIGQAIGRWGNFFNGEAHGAVTTLEHLKNLHLPQFIIDGMYIGGNYYQPTFLYESLWCILGFILISLFIKHRRYDGQIILMYMTWYGFERMFVEGLRMDSLMIGNLRVSQVLSAVIFLFGLITLIVMNIKIKSKHDDEYLKLFVKTEASAELIKKADAIREAEKAKSKSKKTEETEENVD